jgi:hypothetical protein
MSSLKQLLCGLHINIAKYDMAVSAPLQQLSKILQGIFPDDTVINANHLVDRNQLVHDYPCKL